MRWIIFVFSYFISTFFLVAQDNTMSLHIDLNSLNDEKINIEVLPPPLDTNIATFIIPKIVPGTYMRVNYIRNFSKFKAYDKSGKTLKIYKRENRITIKNATTLHRITYQVKHSFSGKRIWDNILVCGGTVFTDSAYLINFQLISGYFLNHAQTPIQITIKRPAYLTASTSQEIVSQSSSTDIFKVTNYEQLVDQPVMYHLPDTASFKVDQTHFHIAVHNRSYLHTADSLKPYLNKIMDSIHVFMGGFNMKDYYVMLFTVDEKKTSRITKLFLNAALEHRQSYVLTGFETKEFKHLIPLLNYLTAHEFLHTWAPLHIHSEKNEPYPFEKNQNITSHLWMYEGTTDYLAGLFCKTYQFPNQNNFAEHVRLTLKQKPRNFMESSKHIAESNPLNFISKIKQIGGAYSRGQLISFCLDLELLKLSEGKMNLQMLMHKMNSIYRYGKPFKEDSLFQILSQRSYPQVESYLNRYVNSKQLPPFQEYLNLLGWRYFNKNERIPSFGKLGFRYDRNTKRVFVINNTQNSLGLQAGDSIDIQVYSQIYQDIFWPSNSTDTLDFQIRRNGKSIRVCGLPVFSKKNKYPFVKIISNPTQKQIQFRVWYNQRRNLLVEK